MSQNPSTPDSSESTPDMPSVPLRRRLYNNVPLDVSLYAVQSISDSFEMRTGVSPASMDITPVDKPSYPASRGCNALRLQEDILADQGFEMKRLSWDDEELDATYGPKRDYEIQHIIGRDFSVREAATVLASIGITLTCPDAPKVSALAAA